MGTDICNTVPLRALDCFSWTGDVIFLSSSLNLQGDPCFPGPEKGSLSFDGSKNVGTIRKDEKE